MTDFVAGAEQRLNPTSAGNQSAPKIAGLTGGGYAVTWFSSYADMNLQLYDASGAAIGEETNFGQSAWPWSIAGLADGGFVISWTAYYWTLAAQRYDANGTVVTPAFTVNSGGVGDILHSSVAALSDGGFAVAWATEFEGIIWDDDYTSPPSNPRWYHDQHLYAQAFDAAGAPTGDLNNLQNNFFLYQWGEFPSMIRSEQPVTAGLAGGGYAVAWQDFALPGCNVNMRIYDASGAAVGGIVNVGSTASGLPETAIAALTGGDFVVVWTSQGQDGSGAGIFAQRYDATGAAVGSKTLINTTTAGDQHTGAIAGLPDGGYVVAWAGDHAGGTDIYAQRYDADGNPIGGETRVSQVTEVGQGEPAITVRGDGSYLIAWTSGNEGAGGQEIYSRIYWPDDVAAKVVTGTEGNDNLGGAAGNDTLIGLGGDDWLNGAPGADLMQGGTGNDTYVVDDAGDVVEEGADAGIDTVRAALAAYALPDNVENLVYSGRTAFIGDGNSLANAITGGIAEDVLRGGNGNDRLNGGEGNDTLHGDRGADQLYGGRGHDRLGGGAGNDALYGGSGVDWLDGGLGDDMMVGGAGVDTYVVDSLGDQVIEAADAGIDTVRTTLAAYTLGDNVENLVFIGSGPFSGIGNALANVLTGGAGNDELRGLDNNDTLQGENGDDTLYGGRGHDTLDGGEGNDQLFGGSGVDTIEGGAGNDRIEGGAGGDTLAAGAGRDLFIYRDVSDSGGNTIDTITDFNMAGRDLINLSIIDANSTTPDNDRFTYIGASAFSGVAGELRYSGGLLEGDVNGDKIADLAIKVANMSPDGRDIIL